MGQGDASAERVGDRRTPSYALRHLAYSAHEAGELDFRPGPAANLSAPAQPALDRGRPEQAAALVEEATGIAESCAADGVLRWVEPRSGLGRDAGRPVGS
ncbi:hypothetical protein LN042_28950 [Kitasatospora sp. RB6PN24]|uniref:hypothetical protein n=1 Tax=Kitasatospora humi TaxID=2893891 RepID=UPI001E29CA98|nr:hypothetical protein [Kitasatospora humi]MCC9311050.1 hypothetical protein [Kitasatospora humi]